MVPGSNPGADKIGNMFWLQGRWWDAYKAPNPVGSLEHSGVLRRGGKNKMLSEKSSPLPWWSMMAPKIAENPNVMIESEGELVFSSSRCFKSRKTGSQQSL